MSTYVTCPIKNTILDLLHLQPLKVSGVTVLRDITSQILLCQAIHISLYTRNFLQKFYCPSPSLILCYICGWLLTEIFPCKMYSTECNLHCLRGRRSFLWSLGYVCSLYVTLTCRASLSLAFCTISQTCLSFAVHHLPCVLSVLLASFFPTHSCFILCFLGIFKESSSS